MTLSIVIPCYNDQMVLPRAVNSALALKCEKEIIVVDDGSATPVRNIWGAPVRVLRHAQNKGLSQALNTGISKSTFDRFTILASDDELDPGYTELLAYDTDIVSCDFRANGNHIKCCPGDLRILKQANCHSYAALIKKEIWRKVGGYNLYMNPSWEDYEFFLHAAKVGAVWHHVSKPLHIYYSNTTGRDSQSQGMDIYLRSLMAGFHQDIYGKGAGVVTFIIPCYNQARFLKDSLLSVFGQSYPHVTAVVVDDASPDDVAGAVSKLDLPVDKVVGVRHTENKHLSAARNTGINIAKLTWNPQWLVPLDADDAVAPEYIDACMQSMTTAKQFVYTDVAFIGDAWHTYKLKPFDCKYLSHKHQHPCTILMPGRMYYDVVDSRGHGYDENMKQGYEDWDFSIGAVGVGYSPVHLGRTLFHYRFHENGSMRTEASQIKDELGKYVRNKISNRWVTNETEVDKMPGCKTCGKNRTRIVVSGTGSVGGAQYYVPGLGDLPGDEIIVATYAGPRQETLTKVGQSGKVYHYSGNENGTYGPNFEIFARDIHLFLRGFTFAYPEPEEVPEPPPPPPEPEMQQMPEVAPVEEVHEYEVFTATEEPQVVVDDAHPVESDNQIDPILEEMEEEEDLDDFPPDNLTELKNVGKATADKLVEAGIEYFEDLEELGVQGLADLLGWSEKKAEATIYHAIELSL